jgi:hypothetical protein
MKNYEEGKMKRHLLILKLVSIILLGGIVPAILIGPIPRAEATAGAGTIPNPLLAETPGFPYTKGLANLYAAGHWTGTIQIPPNASPGTVTTH